MNTELDQDGGMKVPNDLGPLMEVIEKGHVFSSLKMAIIPAGMTMFDRLTSPLEELLAAVEPILSALMCYPGIVDGNPESLPIPTGELKRLWDAAAKAKKTLPKKGWTRTLHTSDPAATQEQLDRFEEIIKRKYGAGKFADDPIRAATQRAANAMAQKLNAELGKNLAEDDCDTPAVVEPEKHQDS